MFVNDIFIERLPKIDLHGCDRDSARVFVNDFIDEAVMMGYDEVVIIHGIGSGIVKDAVHDTLKKHKKVLSYYLNGFNLGCTICKIKKS